MTIETAPCVLDEIRLLLRPFNREGIELTRETTFREDLALDSLAVMELVAAIEDRFDILMPLNLLPGILTVGDLADCVAGLAEQGHA